jgi:DNA-binding LytR/AlgR family response regulator
MPDKRKISNPYYPDVQLFLILIPFMNAFNYCLTYSNIRLNGFLLLTFTIDTVQGYLAWLGVRYLILFLDKKWPYEEGPLRRIAFQLFSTTVTGLLIISVLTELVSWLARGRPAPLHFYTRDLVIISVWFLVINGIYIGLHYYREWQKAEAIREEEKQIRSEGMVVTHGKKDIRLNFYELAGFFVEGDYVVACTTAGKQYYLDQSLRSVEEMLPAAFFFRLNRQFMLHRQVISGFRRAENGKIQVLLKEHECFPPKIPVSRTKAPSFKNWFRPEGK